MGHEHFWKHLGLVFGCWALMTCHAGALPLKAEVLNPQQQPIGQVLIYVDYVEIADLTGKVTGKVGFVNAQGNYQLFLVGEDEQKTLVGWASEKKLYNRQEEVIASYDWTTFWAYAYSIEGKKLGQAKCLAFRGLCAAAITAYLAGLFGTP